METLKLKEIEQMSILPHPPLYVFDDPNIKVHFTESVCFFDKNPSQCKLYFYLY